MGMVSWQLIYFGKLQMHPMGLEPTTLHLELIRGVGNLCTGLLWSPAEFVVFTWVILFYDLNKTFITYI